MKNEMFSLKKQMDLSGRRALITGAGGHLGRTFALTLAQLGADLILVDRDGTDYDGLLEDLSSFGGQTDIYSCDLEDANQRAVLIDYVKSRFETLNILVNNAAFVGTSNLSGWAVPFEQQTLETWRRAFEVNLTAAFDLCQAFMPMLRISPGASIVNIASIYGERAPVWQLYEETSIASPAAYGVSKGGLIQLTRWLATTVAPTVRVNSISPGGISRGQPEVFVKRYEERTPLGRMGNEIDFAGAIAFLASDMSAYVTGQNLFVDGGWSVW